MIRESEFKDLASSKIETGIKKGMIHDLAAIKQLILEALLEPTLKFDLNTNTYEITGINASYKDIYDLISADVEQRLKVCVLAFVHQKLRVTDHRLLGKLSDLPENLKSLIFRRIEIYYKPQLNKKMPTWAEKD